MAALPLTGITTSMVASAIGEGSNDVGTLCSSNKINKWSKWKPVRSNSLSGLTETDIENVKYGIRRVDKINIPWLFEYDKPRGGTYNEYYRLGDFRGYDHNAVPPINYEIISVTSSSFSTQTQAPFVLIEGFTYTINFKLPILGLINPTVINSKAVPTKNTNPAGGYGGLSWASEPYVGAIPIAYRASNQVFSCPDATQYSQQIVAQSTVRLQYCEYLGDTDGRYKLIDYVWAEVEGLIDKFNVRDLLLSFTYHSTDPVWYNPIAKQVFVRTVITNSELFDISNLRFTFRYTINSGSEITLVTNSFNVAAGNTINSVFQIQKGIEGQDNTYSVHGWLELYNSATSTWIEVNYAATTKVVYIPVPA